MAAGAASPLAIAKKIFKFLPFQALLPALALKPLEYPEGLQLVLGKLGATLAPLALVSVGCQLRLDELRGRIAALSAGLAFKLVMGPALIMGLFTGALGAGGTTIQVTILEAAMAPQIGASIVAQEHKPDPPLITLMVGIGASRSRSLPCRCGGTPCRASEPRAVARGPPGSAFTSARGPPWQRRQRRLSNRIDWVRSLVTPPEQRLFKPGPLRAPSTSTKSGAWIRVLKRAGEGGTKAEGRRAAHDQTTGTGRRCDDRR